MEAGWPDAPVLRKQSRETRSRDLQLFDVLASIRLLLPQIMDVPWRQRRLRLSRILFTGPGSSAAEGNDAEQRHGMALDKRAHSKG
jgi:hypothetical protein